MTQDGALQSAKPDTSGSYCFLAGEGWPEVREQLGVILCVLC